MQPNANPTPRSWGGQVWPPHLDGPGLVRHEEVANAATLRY